MMAVDAPPPFSRILYQALQEHKEVPRGQPWRYTTMPDRSVPSDRRPRETIERPGGLDPGKVVR